MNRFFGVLCLILYPAIASATNFDVCVNEAKTNHNDTAGDGFTSYKCEGATAEKLSARPDECTGGAKPSLRSLARKSRQLDDGLYSSMSWTAGKCVGSCEMRSYDSQNTTYLCEVRVYSDVAKPAPPASRPAPESEREPLPPGPGGGEIGSPGPGGRQAANAFRLRRRPPPGLGWAPPPPRHYGRDDRYNRYDRYSHYRPGFSRRPWFEPPPPPPLPYYEGNEGYRGQSGCGCN